MRTDARRDAGGDQALDRPGGRLRVDARRRRAAKPPPGRLRAAQVGDAALRSRSARRPRRRAPAARRRCCRRRWRPRREAPAAVGVLRRRAARRPSAPLPPRLPAAARARIPKAVGFTCPAQEPSPRRGAEAGRPGRGPRSRAGRGPAPAQRRGSVRSRSPALRDLAGGPAQVGDRRLAAAATSSGLTPGRLEAEARPSRSSPGSTVARGGAEAAVGVLARHEPGDRASRTPAARALGHRARSGGRDQQAPRRQAAPGAAPDAAAGAARVWSPQANSNRRR